MAKIPPKIINAIRQFNERIQSDAAIKKVILFGSYARGKYSENNDIDVCIITDKSLNNYLTMFQLAPKSVDIDPRIETVVFSWQEYNEKNIFGLLKEIKTTDIEI